MTCRFLLRAACCVRIIAALPLALEVIAWTIHPTAAAAQDQAGPNIIITSDAPGVQRQGAFQQLSSHLSRSRAPLKSVGPGTHNVTFSAGISQPGYYRVFLWWPEVGSNVGNVDVTVSHLLGDSTVTMDEGARTGQWVPMGIFMFGSGGAQVSLIGHPGAILVADAVRLQYLGQQMPPLAFETDALPIAVTGESYEAWLDVLGGTPPFTFAVDPARLPAGLALGANDGKITGMATTVGSYQFDMEVFDQSSQRAVRTYTIEVIRGSAASTRSATVSPNAVRTKSLGRAKQTGFTTKDGVAAGTPPNLSNLVSLIAALPEGEWVRANLNAYSDVWTPPDLRPLYGLSNPAPSKIIEAWSSFAWDPNRGDLWLFGGGHANYSGNDVYRWRGTSRVWERASLPSEIKQDDLGSWQAVDGWDAAPASAHTYDNNMFFPHIDRLVAFGGAAFNSGAPWKREVTPTTNRVTGPFFFNPSLADPNKVGGTTGSHVTRVAPHPEILGGNMWANRDIYVNMPTSPPALSHVDGCTAYGDENGKDVAYIGAAKAGSTQLNLYRYTVNDVSLPSLDTFEQIGVFWTGTDGRTACGIDPVRKLFVRIGNQSIPFTYWNLATPAPNNRDVRVTPVDPTGEFATLLASNSITLQACGFDFDPARSRFLLWCGDGRVWALTPPATASPNGWTIVKQPSPTLATPNGDVGTGLLGKWKYVPNIDAFIGLQDIALGNIWIYKPISWVNPGAATVPNPPTGVAASDGTSTSNVVITWNASANATGYTVYRSTTSGVQGTQLGTATTTTFTDSSPTPGTIYYYSVTATGSGGVSALSLQDSGYAAAVIPGGSLAGVAALPSIVDLTAVGTSDWVHWLPLNRKSSAGIISDYVVVGTGTVSAYFNDPRSFVWTNGTPSTSGNDTSGATTSGIGAGFTFSVAADTLPRTLIIYVGGFNSIGKLTAHLSDASATDYVDTSLSGSGRYDGFYTLTFNAASSGRQLQITWTQLAGSGSIALQGAALR